MLHLYVLSEYPLSTVLFSQTYLFFYSEMAVANSDVLLMNSILKLVDIEILNVYLGFAVSVSVLKTNFILFYFVHSILIYELNILNNIIGKKHLLN